MPTKIEVKSQIPNPKHQINSKFQIPNQSVSLVIGNWLLVIIWLLVFGSWNFKPCYAAPCYGTKMPEKNKFFMGAQNYTIFKRYLEDGFGKVRSTQYFFMLSYGVLDWLSIDLKSGSGNIKQRPLDRAEVDYQSNFAGGYGFRLRFYDKEKIKMLFGFQHISVHPKSRHLGNSKNQAILDDWQWSVLGSYNFNKFTPYLGTRWSRVDYIHCVDGVRKRKMSDLTKEIGLIVGCDIPFSQQIWLNLEGQFLDTGACAVSLNFSF